MNPKTENYMPSVPLPSEKPLLKLKVCGMKYEENIRELANLKPDYLGFIFHKDSSRYFEGTIPELPKTIKKVGVFVDATIQSIIEKTEVYQLDAVQLHGDESAEFCSELKHYLEYDNEILTHKYNLPRIHNDTEKIEIIKVFSIKDTFDFSVLQPYETTCDYFLFDTKGKFHGGNGYAFNWDVLKDYPSTKPYFLSGGIGLESIENIKMFLASEASKHCYAIDVNSQFESEPGMKIIDQLIEFKTKLSSYIRT